MRWIRDATRRFPHRPYYEATELDAICERIITAFLSERYGRVCFPIATEDLKILIEQIAGDLDVYADLTTEGITVEGLTTFIGGEKPSIKVAAWLTEYPSSENRLRTTLAHELGHAVFHQVLADRYRALFEARRDSLTIRCHRKTMLDAPTSNWIEWQAGYASGAFLMPETRLREQFHLLVIGDAENPGLHMESVVGRHLIRRVQAAFRVSEDAARVRLKQHGYLLDHPRTRDFSRA